MTPPFIRKVFGVHMTKRRTKNHRRSHDKNRQRDHVRRTDRLLDDFDRYKNWRSVSSDDLYNPSVRREVKRRVKTKKRHLDQFRKSLEKHQIIDPEIVQGYINQKNNVRRMEERLICHDRKERRELLFSKRKVGKGIKGPKKKILTENSKVRC